MSDFTFAIRIEGAELLAGWNDVLARFPQLIPLFAETITDRHRQDILEFLGQTPGEPVSPWPWVSDRQRTAFFMTEGFGGGIPHERGGENSLEERWQVDVTHGEDLTALVSIEISNDAVNMDGEPFVNFVQGWRQQPGFEQTGWLGPIEITNFLTDEENAMFDEYAKLVNDALKNWKVAD